ncbi:hypothetical protein INS49_007822 [Diaporthe citri]|uniref:uncharacterized protein n=1 Tax=Diaporthe citri TaxID=83186 RepID=UPI001C806242|nr:uncharacterized protein INS49_007822 [Diaporthe citri]KAG6362729.1 hypothetical protein INS49_007822 [Diaporthe citri]
MDEARDTPTPLKQLAQYERVRFNEGLHGKRTRYMGFSQEADDAWNELQEVGIVRLSPEEQMSMEVKSNPDIEKKDYTVYAVGMWHDIHCLVIVSITSVRWLFAVAHWISWHGTSWKTETDNPNMTKLKYATSMSLFGIGQIFTELETHLRWEFSR